MLGCVACIQCGHQLIRPIGEEEKHIWTSLKLETTFWCSACGSNHEFKKSLLFCSSECLEDYMRRDAYWQWKIAFKEEAEKKARSIRSHE